MVQNADGGMGVRAAAATTIRPPAALALVPHPRPHGPSWVCCQPGDTRSDSVAKGVRWLIERQQPDGFVG